MATPGSRVLLGVSTSTLGGSGSAEELLWYEPDLIEIYNYPSEQVQELCRMAAPRGIRVGLHAPTPYDEAHPLTRFCPTGPDLEEAAEAGRLVARTVAFAEAVGAAHVVVHYPTPYPPFAQTDLQTLGTPFLEHLEVLSERHSVPVLLENLSGNPYLRTAEAYADVLRQHGRLGLCLDLGHAHLVLEAPPQSYGALGERVESLHVYNTSPQRYRQCGHELARPDQDPADGFMDLAVVLPLLVETCAPRAVVLEHGGPQTEADARACADWVRELIGS